MSKLSFFAILLVVTGLAAGPVWAANQSSSESPEKHKKTTESQADATSKTFGSWTKHCQPPHEADAEPLCVLAETVQTSSNTILAVISIGRNHPGDPLNIVVSLPPNVSFPSTVHIRAEESDKWGLELQWQRCIPGACIAGGQLNPSTVAHWSGLSGDGKIVFVAASSDEVSVPISMRGFGDAYKALDSK